METNAQMMYMCSKWFSISATLQRLLWTTKAPSFLCAVQTWSSEKACRACSLEYSGAQRGKQSVYRLMISFPGRNGLSVKMLEPLGLLGNAQLRESLQRLFISPRCSAFFTVTFCSLNREWLLSISRGCTWADSSRAGLPVPL